MPHRAVNSHSPDSATSFSDGRAALLVSLADGAWHTEEALAAVVHAEPAQIRDHLAAMSLMGLEMESEPGKGIRPLRRLDPLDADRIRSCMSADVLQRTARLEVFTELDSTNAHLLGAPAPAPGYLTAALAEFQHAGRGRRGRTWNMPLGSGIGLSVGWSFAETPGDLAALSLAAGVVTRRGIKALSGCAPALKWPNDLVWDHRKLGGILVETASRQGGSCHVVVGLGLNVSMGSEGLKTVGEHPGSATDLETMTTARPPPRNALAAGLIEGYCEMFRTFGDSGFGAYHDSFREADYLRRRPVMVADGPNRLSGIAEGVDASGALIVMTATGTRRIVSGDVTVRPAQ